MHNLLQDRSIDKTIKEFNDKYGSTLLENMQRMELQTKENNDRSKSGIFITL